MILAIAMTEPGTGSDLAGITTTAVRDGDSYVLDGGKTFITGGHNADRVLVVCRTSRPDESDRRGGLSILLVDTAAEGFAVGRTLEKIGLHAQDTVELSFSNVRVPAGDLLGDEGRAFEYLSHNLPQERLTIGVSATAAATRAVQLANAYANDRTVFGQPLATFQNTKFVLAECATEVAAAQAMVDQALEAHDRGELEAADAAKLKLFTTEVQATPRRHPRSTSSATSAEVACSSRSESSRRSCRHGRPATARSSTPRWSRARRRSWR